MKKINRKKLQDYINRLSRKPELWKRFRNIYHINDLIFDFSELDFSGRNFSNFDFSNIYFTSANFNHADFGSTNFYHARFNHTDFNSANFYFTNFDSANFDYADFDYANFSCTNFNHANFNYASFDYAKFNSADFNSADFNYTKFNSVNFSSASFYSADFNYTSFYYADFNSTNFDYANFNCVDFYRASFDSTNFDSIDFSFANFDHVKFSYKSLKKLVSLRAKMKYLDFLEVDKYYVGFKVFGEFHEPNPKWMIREGSVIKEKYVNDNLYRDCGHGINIANKNWILKNAKSNEIWIVAIDRGDKIVVLYESDGKIRVNRCKLLKKITREQLQNMSDDDILNLVKEVI